MKPRPVIYVLAGVNGAGKSSVGGHLLTRAGLAWFNPDAFARELRAAAGLEREVILMGMGRHFELWDKATYEAKEAEAMQGETPDAFKELSF